MSTRLMILFLCLGAALGGTVVFIVLKASPSAIRAADRPAAPTGHYAPEAGRWAAPAPAYEPAAPRDTRNTSADYKKQPERPQ